MRAQSQVRSLEADIRLLLAALDKAREQTDLTVNTLRKVQMDFDEAVELLRTLRDKMNNLTATWKLGQRVQLHPATDAWMRGDRYGSVVKTARCSYVHVRMDTSKKIRRVHPDNLLPA